jgi:hypothetical protein
MLGKWFNAVGTHKKISIMAHKFPPTPEYLIDCAISHFHFSGYVMEWINNTMEQFWLQELIQ